ncbi:MAG: 4-hydroxythreonine-4-phosphate dehydrogenase PdxA [Candidatus Omnitrophota bacterium]
MRIFPTNKPVVFITMGDPAGIGPEVIIKTLFSADINKGAVFVIIGDRGTIEKAALKACVKDHRFNFIDESGEDILLKEDSINVLDPGPFLAVVEPGVPTDSGAAKALKCLDIAIDLIKPLSPGKAALVTAPVNKERIAGISPGFIGHTEYLAEAYRADSVTMVMVGQKFSVIPLTRHIPLKEVVSGIKEELIIKTLQQIADKRFILSEKKEAKIGVCALNPHCGEGGEIGREEIDIIAPAVKKAKEFYPDIVGPISGDVVFYKALKGEIDIILAMYHDQALAPFKMIEFESGVNLTLGLKHIRTSPDHGTAFDIAGKDIASFESMQQAINLALRAINSR